MKPVKRGIKVWVLADSHNGYFQKFQVYTGKRWWKAPAILSCGSTCIQRAMDSLLQGMANVAAYMDDILVTGESEQERLQNLDSVLQKLETAGVRLKKSKCLLMAPEVEYLGHKISSEGLHPMPVSSDARRNREAGGFCL